MALGGDINLLTNLVGYYPFDANADDFSGKGYNGTLVNSPTFVSGKLDNAISFDTSNTLRYVDIADNNDFSFTNGTNDVPFSISFWAMFDAFSSTGSWLVSKRQNDTNLQEWQVAYSLSGAVRILSVSLASGSNLNTNRIDAISNSNIFSTGVWYHIALTYDGSANQSGLNIYVDGALNVASRAQVGTYVGMTNTASVTTVGQGRFVLNQAIKHRGKIDDLAIWKNRELTLAEVQFIYNAGSGRKIIP
jgi:hypothetical protein